MNKIATHKLNKSQAKHQAATERVKNLNNSLNTADKRNKILTFLGLPLASAGGAGLNAFLDDDTN